MVYMPANQLFLDLSFGSLHSFRVFVRLSLTLLSCRTNRNVSTLMEETVFSLTRCSHNFKRPSLERKAKKVGWALGRFSNKSFIVSGKLCRSAGTRFWFQSFKAVLVKFFDNRPNMMLGVVNQPGDSRNFIVLIGNNKNPCSSDFDVTCAARKDSLNLPAFINTEGSGVQTYKKCLSMQNNIELFFVSVYIIPNYPLASLECEQN